MCRFPKAHTLDDLPARSCHVAWLHYVASHLYGVCVMVCDSDRSAVLGFVFYAALVSAFLFSASPKIVSKSNMAVSVTRTAAEWLALPLVGTLNFVLFQSLMCANQFAFAPLHAMRGLDHTVPLCEQHGIVCPTPSVNRSITVVRYSACPRPDLLEVFFLPRSVRDECASAPRHFYH